MREILEGKKRADPLIDFTYLIKLLCRCDDKNTRSMKAWLMYFALGVQTAEPLSRPKYAYAFKC